MKKLCLLNVMIVILGTAAVEAAPLVVTSSNTSPNQLLVYSTGGQLLQTIPTGGNGGVSGNAGGIETNGNLTAVVNFGSLNVSIFEAGGSGLEMKQLITTISSPVSVAFGNNHLYILGTTEVESHRIAGSTVGAFADGEVQLVVADGSAAQVGVVTGQLVIAEKSNMIETVNLLPGGAVSGIAKAVQGIPSNVNTPFGMATRGNNAYVTIAHANEISLVQNGAIVALTSSGTQNAPCWLTLAGPYLFSSNSPSMSISRYFVYQQRMVQDVAVAATLDGDPTDIASAAGFLAVIDGNGPLSHLTIFSVDNAGNLSPLAVEIINSAANGAAIVAE